MEELKSSLKWHKELFPGVTILDFDGWDRRNLEYSYEQELITKQQFIDRLSYSTVEFKIIELPEDDQE